LDQFQFYYKRRGDIFSFFRNDGFSNIGMDEFIVEQFLLEDTTEPFLVFPTFLFLEEQLAPERRRGGWQPS